MSPTVAVLLSIATVNALASIPIAFWAHRDFESDGKLGVLAAICLGIVYYLHVAAAFAVALSGDDRGSLPLPRVSSVGIGLVCLAAGSGVIVAGRLTFHSRARVYGRLEDKLLVRGIYAWSRNPQYFGTFLVLLGAAIVGTSIVTLFLAGAFFLLIHFYIVMVEEPHLSKSFTDSYSQYRSDTNRYVGFRTKKQDRK